MKHLKCTIERQVVSAGVGLMYLGGLVFFMGGPIFVQGIFELLLVPLIFCIAPMIPIHINYFVQDYYKELIIDKDSRVITLKDFGFKRKLTFDEIVKIEIYSTYSGSRPYMWKFYKYAKFFLADGKYFVITSFVIDFKNEDLSDFTVDKQEKFYPWVYKNKNRII
jgi:hypothetical protein